MARFRLVLLLAVVGALSIISTVRLSAATVVAGSPNRSDVLTAFNACSDGDTLSIPAGTGTGWNSALTISKNIVIKGAGRDSTFITGSANGTSTPILRVTATGAWRITGITFQETWTVGGGVGISVAADNGRISHCRFKQFDNRGIWNFGKRTVIDHNIFEDCWSSIGNYADQWTAWQRALDLGTTNAVCMEDNYIHISGSFPTPVGIDHGQGARSMARYNVLSNVGLNGFDYFLDAHGNQGSPPFSGSSVAGTVYLESYKNFVSVSKGLRGNYLRGGTQLHYANTYQAQSGNWVSFGNTFFLTEEDGYRAGNPISSNWPAIQQITNSYFWANRFNGAAVTQVKLDNPGTTPCTNPSGCGSDWPSDGIFIQEGRDYWMQAPVTNFYLPLAYPHPRIVADNDPAIPTAFALTSPANGATGFSVNGNLAWGASSGHTEYKLIIARDTYFADVALESAISPGSTGYGPIQPGILENNVKYYWLVRAVGANGVNTSTGAPWSFTTGAAPTLPPVTPSNSSPADGAVGQSLTVTLQGSAYSDPQSSAHQKTQFILYASDQTTIVANSGELGAVTTYAIASGTLDYSTVYYWKVRYRNSFNLWSEYSDLTSFVTLGASAPTTPTNTTPANGATDVSLSPTLTASAYSDPQSSAQSASQWQVILGTNVIDSGEWPAATTYNVPVVLSNATAYTWQVRYKNGYDLWSAYSAATTFTTTNSASVPDPPPPPPPPPDPVAPNTPVNLSPSNNSFNITLTPELLASDYTDPQLSPQAASQWVVLHAGTNLIDSGSYAATNTFPVTNILTALTLYSWQVRYQNTHGLWSSYSTPTSFTTTNVVIPPDPPPPSTNPPVTPPPDPPVPTNALTRTNILIFRGTVELRGIWSSE